jgi:hypothetical protein
MIDVEHPEIHRAHTTRSSLCAIQTPVSDREEMLLGEVCVFLEYLKRSARIEWRYRARRRVSGRYHMDHKVGTNPAALWSDRVFILRKNLRKLTVKNS